MSHELNNSQPIGGMDFDTELRSITPNDFVFAKNIRTAINQINKGGSLVNIKGNIAITKYCLPYNNGIFPAGKNRVIGSVEDTKYGTVIFFVWNQFGKHQILRYYRNLTSPANPYGEVQQVIQYNFGWTKRTRINSANIVYGTQEAGADSELTGDLLYWCDKKPRKINITKAQICGKKKCWNLYLPVTIEGNIPDSTTYTFKNFAGATIFTKTIDTSNEVSVLKTIKYVRNTTPEGTNFEIVIEDANLDLSGVTQIEVVLGLYPATYTILNWRYNSAVNATIFGVASYAAPDYFSENVLIQYTVPEAEARNFILGKIADAFNDDATSPVTAEFCDCHLEFCEKVSGTVWTILSDADANIISPDNWYGATLIERFFDRCKWQPLNAPRGTFEKDLNYEPNYVKRKVFQFRLEYDYDDLERSALGVWSQIPINNLGCDGTSDASFNYIDVNFEDDLIANAETLVLLKRIRFVARELNTGADRSVIELEPCDFLDYANGAWFCHFNFYNDIISSPIDAATAAKLFDNVPLESNDERFVKNRIVEGGILEGYDAPECVKAKAQVEFVDLPNKPFKKIRGRIRIITFGLQDDTVDEGTTFYSLLPNYNKYPFWEHPSAGVNYNIRRGGIFTDLLREDTVGTWYGGGTFGSGAGGDFGINFQFTGKDSQQASPESAFTVYAAGTPYSCLSRQINIGLPTNEDGALDVSTTGRINAIGAYLYAGGDLYSEFELLVPDDSTYVLRIASNLASYDDKYGAGFMYNITLGTNYQKTSTNVWAYVDENGVQQSTKEVTVTVSGSDITIGDFLIMDLSPPYDQTVLPILPTEVGLHWYPYYFYLYDDSNGTTVNVDPNSQSFTGISVEKTLVISQTESIWRARPIDFRETDNIYNISALTDHNGYFFGISDAYFPLTRFNAHQVNAKQISSNDFMYVGTLSKLVSHDFIPISVSASNDIVTAFGVITTTVADARTDSFTHVTGFVKNNNGEGINNVLAIYQSGQVDSTDDTGYYFINAWGDMITPNLGVFSTGAAYSDDANRIVDNIVFELAISCSPEYPNGQILSPILVDPYGSAVNEYNPTNPYISSDFIIIEGNDPTKKALKRGGNDLFGARGYDDAGRLCSVFPLFELYMPFITEDIGKYGIEDFGGVIYPSATYKFGKPTVKVVLDPTTVFPLWMKYLQIMRTKNTIYGRYLQWVANQVTYVVALEKATDPVTPEIKTSFQNGDATAIKISISNILDYSAQNNDSLVGYQYQAGDRVRLIADRTLNYIQGLNDFEVTSYDSTTQEVIIKPERYPFELKSGMLFEIFNPKSVATEDEQIYYEVGEVIKVNNGIPSTYSVTLTSGDTYWRGRLVTVNDESTNFAAAYPVVIEDASVSDFYPSEAQDIGRIGIIDPAFKQVYAPTKVRCSNVFLPSTAINGLSSFEELNQKEFDRANGQIERLLQKENTIIAVTSLREISNYIEVVSFQQADVGDGVLAIANQYFGTEYPHAKRLGTDLPSTVLINDGQAFGFQSARGEAWRYQGDGEQAISDIKMNNFFQQLSVDGVSDATAVYHRYNEEYYLTLNRVYQQRSTVTAIGASTFSVPFTNSLPTVGEEVTIQYLVGGTWTDVTGTVSSISGNTVNLSAVGVIFTVNQDVNVIYSISETVVFFNGNDTMRGDRWMRFDSRTPERWEQCGSNIVSFKDGRIWVEEVNPIYNNFYNIQHETAVSPVFNDQPKINKYWASLWMEQFQDNRRCNWRADRVYNTNNQLSRLKAANWKKYEQDWYIDFKRNINDTTVPNPIVNSPQVLRSSALVVELQNNHVGEITLYGWRCLWTESPRTIK